MNNVFNIIKQHIRLNDTPTYGDLLNENKSIANENAIRRLCTAEEYEEYKEIYNKDKNRLINESGYTDLKDNYLMNTQVKEKEQFVFGIGEVKQMC